MSNFIFCFILINKNRKPNGNLIECLPELMAWGDGKFEVLFSMLKDEMRRAHIEQVKRWLPIFLHVFVSS